jgi:hypothetical protein
MESSSFLRMGASHVLSALGAFIVGLTCMLLIAVDDDMQISAAIGLGFGQISMLAIWCVTGISRTRFWASAIAVLACLIAMALWVAILGNSVDGAFFLSLAIFSVVYFFAIAAVLVFIRKVRRISVEPLVSTQAADHFSGQYGIRDILIVMSIVAVGIAVIKFFSALALTHDIAEMFAIFALISASFFLMSWPIVVTCLNERWRVLAIFSSLLVLAICLLQPPIFRSILGPGGSFGFFCFLDIPFVFAVALHSLIARSFGYRLRTLSTA